MRLQRLRCNALVLRRCVALRPVQAMACWRVCRGGQLAVLVDAQGFAFDAAQALGQQGAKMVLA